MKSDFTFSNNLAGHARNINFLFTNGPSQSKRTITCIIPMRYMTKLNTMELAVDYVLHTYPEKVKTYRTGTYAQKLTIRGFFVGMTFKHLGGRGKRKIILELLEQRLS